MDFLSDPTRFLFFTGQGGVGKTSHSCATAIDLAGREHKVFLVCTDPASNLSDVLGIDIGTTPTYHPKVPELCAININPEKAAETYRERIIGPYRGKLPEAALASMEEQLSGACTMEIAAFDEFAGLLGNNEYLQQYDYVIFDTAPTGHTLRLLQLPSAWDGFIETNTTGTSCLGPLSGLTKQHQVYKNTIATLTNTELTTVVLVCRADTTSLTEAARTSSELSALGMNNQKLIINGVFTSTSDDKTALAWQKRTQIALANLPNTIRNFDLLTAPLMPCAPLGVERLLSLRSAMQGEEVVISYKAMDAIDLPPRLSHLFIQIGQQENGVIMTMGKGGVGKTSIATELALFLSQKGYNVLLATTDPAAHLDFSLGENIKNLTVAKIDPKKETKRYTDKVMSETGSHLDEHGKELLAEDLRSPCTEEIAVFQAFAQLVHEGEGQFIVLDTAPTGHTLLLLDAAKAYHKEVERTTQQIPEEVGKLLPRMRDPVYTKVLIVTLPELTPIQEALELEKDLKRAGIDSNAWIINQSLAPLAVTDTLLLTKQQEELPHIEKLMKVKGAKVFISEWKAGQNEEYGF